MEQLLPAFWFVLCLSTFFKTNSRLIPDESKQRHHQYEVDPPNDHVDREEKTQHRAREEEESRQRRSRPEERRQQDVTTELKQNMARNYLHERKYQDELDSWLRKIRDEAYVDIKKI